MKNALMVIASLVVGFLLGVLAQRHVFRGSTSSGTIAGGPGAESHEAPNRDILTMRLQPLPVTGDSREALLVLQRRDKTLQTWPLDGIWMDDWENVAVNEITTGNATAWWLSWRAGSGTGLGPNDGAVIWFAEEDRPAFWRGTWAHTESFLGEAGYEYEYSTELLLRPGASAPVQLLVEVSGEASNVGKIHGRFLCVSRRVPDGSWTFLAQDEYQGTVQELLDIEQLSSVHDQLRSFVGRSNGSP